jgi:GNAT superfamily N-acetyltransferase
VGRAPDSRRGITEGNESRPPGLKEWLDNRKSFLEADGSQQQFVATLGDQIVGYAAAEHPPAWMRNKPNAEGEYRLFVVVEPSARKTLGTRLLDVLGKYLVDHGARRAWIQEYEADKGLASFFEQKGFVKRISFTAENRDRIVRHSMDAPFDSFIGTAREAATDVT